MVQLLSQCAFLRVLLAVTLSVGSAQASYEDAGFDARAVGGAFNTEEELALRGLGVDADIEDVYFRELDDEDVGSRDVTQDDLQLALRQAGFAHDHPEARHINVVDEETELMLRELEDEEAVLARAAEDGFEQNILRALADEEAEVALRAATISKEANILKAASSAVGSVTSTARAPISTTPVSPSQIQVQLAPVNCKAATMYLHKYHKTRASYKRWVLRWQRAQKAKNEKGMQIARKKAQERREYMKRLLAALLMQGRVR